MKSFRVFFPFSFTGKVARQLVPDKATEFDPIKQHRHFCPWIASVNDEEPGWKQTLSALYHQKNPLRSSPHRSPLSASIFQVLIAILSSDMIIKLCQRKLINANITDKIALNHSTQGLFEHYAKHSLTRKEG